MASPSLDFNTQSDHEVFQPNTSQLSTRKRRVRARRACEPCRERKRRCDNNHPCGPCVRYEYACHYVSVRRRTKTDSIPEHTPTAASEVDGSGPVPTCEDSEVRQVTDHQLQSREANSGAAFVRKLALALDPAKAPRLQLFAWNLFLGARTLDYHARARPIVDIISRATMESLATIYLDKVDPCYGFIDQELLQQRIQSRWDSRLVGDPYDAVLAGIAALGFLFSRTHVEPVELDLIESAKCIVEQSTDAQPGIDVLTGWVLRVAYLRMTTSPHTAWLASCTMMHMIEASGILSVEKSPSTPLAASQDLMPELHKRLFGIARHLNIWISFDLTRSRVFLPYAESAMPSARPGDYTVELLGLLPLLERLSPEKKTNIPDLKAALRDLLIQKHTEPPSVLAQCNLALLLLRRLRALDFNLSGSLLDQLLALTSKAISSAQAMLNTGNPWHHVGNVPFQVVCILIAIDTPSAIAQIADAIKILSNITQIFNTWATNEALSTACLLVYLHRKRKVSDARSLAEILQIYSPFRSVAPQITTDPPLENNTILDSFDNPTWLDESMIDMLNLPDFDINQFLVESDGQSFSAE